MSTLRLPSENSTEEKRAWTESNKEVEDNLRYLVGRLRDQLSLYFEAASSLAVNFKLRPLEWVLQKDSLSPELRDRIEELMKLLPPATPPFSDNDDARSVRLPKLAMSLKDRMTGNKIGP